MSGPFSSLKRRWPFGTESLASGIVIAWAALAPSSAQAETRAWVNVSADADYSSNPFLLVGPDTSAASAIVGISPGVRLIDADSTITLTGSYKRTEYSRRYRGNNDYSANASISRQFTPRLSYNASFGYDNVLVGANELLTNSVIPIPGGVFLPPPGGIALNGLRQRRQSLNGGMDLSYAASSRDSIQARTGFTFVRFPSGSFASEYDNPRASLGYSRTLNSATSIGLNLDVSRADYRRTVLGDATTFSPQATFKTKLSASWSLTASGGASISRITTPLGKVSRRSASGDVSLCNKGGRTNLCFFASRSVQPTTFGGSVGPQTSIGVSYQYQLDTLSTFDFNGSFSRSSTVRQNNVVTTAAIEYGNANLTYSRLISQRLRAHVGARYADSYKDPTPRKADFSVLAGVSYTFGDYR